jgi:hypothetical protein
MTIGLIKDWELLKRRVDATHAHYAGEDVGMTDELHQKLNNQLIAKNAPGKVYRDGSVSLDDGKESTKRGMERRLATKGYAIGKSGKLVKLNAPMTLSLGDIKDVGDGIQLRVKSGIALKDKSQRVAIEKIADSHSARVEWSSDTEGKITYGRSYLGPDYLKHGGFST